MKRVLLEAAFYIISVALQIIPVIIAYGVGIPISPLFVWLIVPFYLLIGCITFSGKYHCIISVWRIIPCVLSLYICYIINMSYISRYFEHDGYPIEPWTVWAVNVYYIISAIIIVSGLVIYQTVELIRYFYKRFKNRQNNDNDVEKRQSA